jgi:small multidrug resistance pump
VTYVPENSGIASTPRWQTTCLALAGLQCLIWGLYIIFMPARSAISYGLDRPPREIFLWQGTGLVIFLFGVGYLIASTNPRQHWVAILTGLLAKVLGPVGIAWSVVQGQVPSAVLLLLPVNDVIWWIPFGLILFRIFQERSGHAANFR